MTTESQDLSFTSPLKDGTCYGIMFLSNYSVSGAPLAGLTNTLCSYSTNLFLKSSPIQVLKG